MGLLNTLIKQAKNPRGFVGNMMIKIMNKAHASMTTWGLSKIVIQEATPILDIGQFKRTRRLSLLAKLELAEERYQPCHLMMDISVRLQPFRLIISALTLRMMYMNQYTNNEQIKQLFQESGFQTVDIHENNKWRCYIGVK